MKNMYRKHKTYIVVVAVVVVIVPLPQLYPALTLT